MTISKDEGAESRTDSTTAASDFAGLPAESARAPEVVSIGRTALLVLGMHRSGTSSLAGTLIRLGAKAPKSLLPATTGNERGYFESVPVMRLNNEILRSAGSAWDDWSAFNAGWLTSPAASEFAEKASMAIDDEFGSTHLFVLKDPRICRMAPFWLRVLEQTGYDVRVAMPVRSPIEVAQSLRRRNGFPISKGLLLWLRHVLDAEVESRERPRAVLMWSDFLADWSLAMSRAGEQMGLSWPRLSRQSSAEIDNYLSSSLRHHIAAPEEMNSHPDVNDWVRETFAAMAALATDPASKSALETLDGVRREFGKASHIFGRILVDFEESAKQAHAKGEAANAQHEKLAAELRSRADGLAVERDAALEKQRALIEQLAVACAQRDKVAAETAEQRARAERLAVERDAALEARRTAADQLAAARAERDRLAAETIERRLRAEALAVERDAAVEQRRALEQQLAASSQRDRREAH